MTTTTTTTYSLPVVYFPEGNNVFNQGQAEGLTVVVALNGASLQAVVLDSVPVATEDYTYDGEYLLLSATLLDSLTISYSHALAITSEGGEETAYFIINDVPVIADKTDFIKYPGEAIVDEDFRGLVTNQLGTLAYTITTKVAYESFTDNHDGTFSFTPVSIYAGTVSFTFTATDEYGATASRDITLTYKTVNPYIYDAAGSKIVNKSTLSEDLVMTVDTSGTEPDTWYFPMQDILLDGVSIGLDNIVFETGGNQYFFSIRKEYLSTLDVGVYTFTLVTAAGTADFIVNIYDRLQAVPLEAAFDKFNVIDVSFTLSGLPLVCDHVTFEDGLLDPADYTFCDGVITFFGSYLATLAYGSHRFYFSNGYGDTELLVTIFDSRSPLVLSTNLTYYGGTSQDLEVAFTMFDKTMVSLKYGDDTVSPLNYEFADGILTIAGTYLETIASGETSLDFTLVTNDNEVQFTVTVEPEVIYPETTQTSDDFQIDLINDVTFTIDLGGNTFSGLEYQDQFLIADVDYTYDPVGKELTFLGNYLVTLFDFTATFYHFELVTAENHNITLTISYEDALYKVLNAGFETGDLYGWTTYALWKDEAGLVGFINERVVSSGYYGSSGTDPYNMDGNYNFGLYKEPYDNTNKDLNQERMGMLRSANFTLAGSGYISFKLGGGKNQGMAYVSVHDAATNEEIARFANRHFGDTALSGTANAEGYMFQYYYDLSAYLGQELYFLIVDGSSHEWNVLAFDSFNPYYPVAPTVSEAEAATNILPVIHGAGSATNTIPNGALTGNLDYWQNANNVFQIANGGAISSVGGNSALGVLRSPAFTIDGANTYLKFDFAGAIASDKQIFVLVKEVGTNLEVLRLVRRADLSSVSASGDFRNHWYDLSGLDPDKEYYLEVVDNKDGDWGVAMIRNVQLVSSGYGSANEVAVNAFYGLAYVNQDTGGDFTYVADLSPVSLAASAYVMTTLGADPATEILINYHSDQETTILEYTLASDPDFAASSKVSVTGSAFSTPVTSSGGITYGYAERYVFKTLLPGLDPDTDYIYRIWDDRQKSETYSFHTAPLTGGFRFLFMTDLQANKFADTLIYRDLMQNAFQLHDDYAFSLVTGDIVESGAGECYWQWFTEAYGNMLPIVPVIGNHEYQDQTGTISSPDYYDAFFNNPQNGPESYLNRSYFINYGDSLFVMIDVVTGDDLASQQAWFQVVVAANPADYLIVATHYSMYGTYHDTQSLELRTDWLALFDQADVDLVCSGHDHIYARTDLLYGGSKATEPDTGTIYLIGGSAGTKLYQVDPLEAGSYEYYQTDTESTLSIVTVTDTEITIQTIGLDGSIVDTFNVACKS